MKRTDLEKLRGLKIRSRLRGATTPERFARASAGAQGAARRNPLLERLLGNAPDGTDSAQGDNHDEETR